MAETHAHAMPFGAELLPGGGRTRFRLWAPAHEAMTLVIEDRRRAVPMARAADGFFDAITDAQAGTRYRFELPDGRAVPDPASRHQPEDVHGPSEVINPSAYAWQRTGWRGREWHEVVLYELHVGTFSDQGTFDGVRRKLDYLARLGITAVELMPVGDFAGRRNWGYDGVLPFAPDAAYGKPADLKGLIDEAHARDLMVFLDVIYNHFGPDGNYLREYADIFFEPEARTPWGAAINYSVRAVRDFAIHNALYWLEEYQIDGLRLDAVDQIIDRSQEHILDELAATVRRTIPAERHVHLVLENDQNTARLLDRDAAGRPVFYDAQWNDDIHHVVHHLLTGETTGYYRDYVHEPHRLLARALSAGFVYQGEASAYRDGTMRGTPSAHLPPTASVAFTQNHDQVGNRALGERIAGLANVDAVKAVQAVLLLAPSIPLLFMGEEWGATQPFRFFVDLPDALGAATREGRLREFERLPEFAGEEARRCIPDPNDLSTFLRARLDWSVAHEPRHAVWLEFVRDLLHLRREAIVSRLAGIRGGRADARQISATALRVAWTLGDSSQLTLVANLANQTSDAGLEAPVAGDVLFAHPPDVPGMFRERRLPPWSVLWFLSQRAS